MSKMFKIVLALAVVLIVAGGLYFWFFHTTQESIPGTAAESSDTLPTGNDTSDTALDSDMAAIEAQMDTFGNDNASIDASLSDEAGEQSDI